MGKLEKFNMSNGAQKAPLEVQFDGCCSATPSIFKKGVGDAFVVFHLGGSACKRSNGLLLKLCFPFVAIPRK